MDFTQIKYFLAVAETLNFTAAAKKCAVSQPALSKAIQKLEADLGADLLVRNPQHVALTTFGETMRIHFERIDDNLRRARGAANAALETKTQRLNIGVMCTIGPHHFSRFLQEFCTTRADIELTLHDITARMIPELLLSGGLDCIFCASADKFDDRFEVVDLLEEEMVVVFSEGHRFGAFDQVPVAEIVKETYLDRLHCEIRNDFLKSTRARGLQLNLLISSEREDWILDLINNNVGVSILPLSSAKMGKVNYRSIQDFQETRKLKLVFTKTAVISPVLLAFADAIERVDLSVVGE